MQPAYLDAIRSFEGFTPKADWDYAQFTNGYGTRARFPGEVIDKVEADRRFGAEISEARAFVEAQVPAADEGTKAALTSLTFNAGGAWSKSGLGEAVRSGDLDKARSLFLQYTKAGGETLPGLVSRRLNEVTWMGTSEAGTMASSAIGGVPNAAAGLANGAAAFLSSGATSVPDLGPEAAAGRAGLQRALAMTALADHAVSTSPADLASDDGAVPRSAATDIAEQLQIMRFDLQPGVASRGALLMHDALARLGQKDREQS